MSGPPPARPGFGFSPNMMADLKSRQKEVGRYVAAGSGSSGDAGEAAGEAEAAPAAQDGAPPIPRRPRPSVPLPAPGESIEDKIAAQKRAAEAAAAAPPNDLAAALARRRDKSDVAPAVPAPAPDRVPVVAAKAAAAPLGRAAAAAPAKAAAAPMPAAPAAVAAPAAAAAAKNPASVAAAARFREQRQQPAAAAAEVEETAASEARPKRRDLEPKKVLQEEWDVYYAEGEPYYVNRATGETTWDKPAALRSAAETEALSGEFVWVRHDELAWVPAKVLERRGDTTVVQERPQNSSVACEERRLVKKDALGPQVVSTQALTSLTADLVQLDEVHEPGIIDLLRRRYNADKIYTSVGDILVAVNPFKPTTLFTPALMHQYAETGREAMELAPHPYAVINSAFRAMLEDGADQSLLISGESGAGKTVTVKVCLEFLSEVAGSEDNIEQKILAANPVLEAFGNAKTVRNDNSSRFGKFMEIHFARGGSSAPRIVGCHTVNYLLEKSRVVDQAKGERNFHIFHYLCAQFSPEQRARYQIPVAPQRFAFLPDATLDADQHDDAKECGKMHQALGDMGFSEAERDGMFRVVAAILHLGNVEFEDFETSGSKVRAACAKSLDTFCALSGTDAKEVADALTMHVSQQRDGLLRRAFSAKVAEDARNALARHLYDRLFEWIVGRINEALVVKDAVAARGRSGRDLLSSGAPASNFIGMLDIFGFEIFEKNSFEQLSINFANEKLQQMFNRHTFTLEEQTYVDEGVPFEQIEFHDSQPLLTFLGLAAQGGKAVRDGVFQLLDEQTAIGGSDDKLLQQVVSRHAALRGKLFSDRCKSRSAFQVFHYAGQVEYETAGFVYKNADKLMENLQAAMAASAVPLVATLFKKEAGPLKTQASIFMRQLSQLEERTAATYPRYIRCVKPNSFKRASLFQAPQCLEQLRFAGVFEAVQIRKKGYPFRRSHRQFFQAYRCVETPAVAKAWAEAKRAGTWRTAVEALLAALAKHAAPQAKDCRLGKTMVLYRAEQHRVLEIQRLGVQNRAAAEIQKMMRGALVRKHLPELRAARERLRAAIATRRPEQLDAALAASAGLFFKLREAYDAEAVKEALQLERSMEPKLGALLARAEAPGADPVADDKLFSDLDQACAQVKRVRKRDPKAFAGSAAALRLLAVYDETAAQRALGGDLEAALALVPGSANAASQELLEGLLADEAARRPRGVKLPALLAAARDAVAALAAERKSLDKAARAALQCAVTPPADGAESVGVEGARASLAALRAAVTALPAAPASQDGADGARRAQWALQLYEAVVLAMDSAQHADDPEWEAVDRLVGQGRSLLAAGPCALLDVAPSQLELLGAELALRAQVDAVVRKLAEAVKAVADEPMSTALEQAYALRLEAHADAAVSQLVATAADLLPRILGARQALGAAAAAVDEQMLYDALVLQSECGWGEREGMVGCEEVAAARLLYSQVQNLTREARTAVQALELEPTRAVVRGCEQLGLRLPELDPLREFLQLPRDRQLLRQREAAVALANWRRAIALSIAHKDLLFDAQGENFALEHFPKLKTPEEFAKRFGLTFSRYKVNMLHHYNPTFGKMHTSLTTLEDQLAPDGKTPLSKVALLMFKNVFGIFGDKNYTNVDALLEELLATGLQTPDLVDEMYCQVMKQLTQNPVPESEAKGWNLMSMMLATFPPSTQLDNYLEYFLRRAGRGSCIKTLHRVQLCGPLRAPPPLADIVAQRNPANTDCWFNAQRATFSLKWDDFQGPPQPDQIVVDWTIPADQEGYAAAPPPPQQQQQQQQLYAPPPHPQQRQMQAPPQQYQQNQPPPPPPKKTAPGPAYATQAPAPPGRATVPVAGGGLCPPPPPPPPKKAAMGAPPPPPQTRQPTKQASSEDEDDML
jgi:hypothetical protein